MQIPRVQKAVLLFILIGLTVSMVDGADVACAQTAVTGALSGVVEDTTGAVLPNANVVITESTTDAKMTAKTNAEGRYTVGLLKPGLYKITASAANLKSDTVEVTVVLGATATGDIKVTPTGTSAVVEVSASDLPLVDSQNVVLATTFNEQQIQELPTPGGDVTTVAYTAPGVVVNAGGMYGNFSSDGLPGISNLFVLNGFDNQDPFLNLNNSGSSNLTLGQGELADETVVQNGYSSQYGRAAGAILNYTTKSGGNRFHGEAAYNYNGTLLNANGWFNNDTGNARPHAVSNEWALNGGGPIVRDKVFFFSDYEGLHYVLPNAGFVSLPSPAYQAYTLATIPASAASTYNQMFGLYDRAPAICRSDRSSYDRRRISSQSGGRMRKSERGFGAGHHRHPRSNCALCLERVWPSEQYQCRVAVHATGRLEYQRQAQDLRPLQDGSRFPTDEYEFRGSGFRCAFNSARVRGAIQRQLHHHAKSHQLCRYSCQLVHGVLRACKHPGLPIGVAVFRCLRDRRGWKRYARAGRLQ